MNSTSQQYISTVHLNSTSQQYISTVHLYSTSQQYISTVHVKLKYIARRIEILFAFHHNSFCWRVIVKKPNVLNIWYVSMMLFQYKIKTRGATGSQSRNSTKFTFVCIRLQYGCSFYKMALLHLFTVNSSLFAICSSEGVQASCFQCWIWKYEN